MMTADEFSAEVDKTVQPAIERLIQLAFATVPAHHVETVVATYFDLMKATAVEAARDMIAGAPTSNPN